MNYNNPYPGGRPPFPPPNQYPPYPPYPHFPAAEPPRRKEQKEIRRFGNIFGTSTILMLPFTFALQFILYIVLFAAGAMEMDLQSGVITSGMDSLAVLLSNMLIYCASMLLPFLIVIMAKMTRVRYNDILPLGKPKKGWLAVSVGSGLGLFMLSNIIVGIMVSIVYGVSGIELNVPAIDFPSAVSGQAVYFITISVLPAFVEEIIFRGIVMQPLRKHGDKFALIASSLLFALMHGNFVQIPFAFILGIVIGYFVIKSESIWVGVLLHFLNNAFSCSYDFIKFYIGEQTAGLVSDIMMGAMLLFGMIFTVFFLSSKKSKRFIPVESTLDEKGKIGAYLSSPGVIIAIAVYICFSILTINIL